MGRPPNPKKSQQGKTLDWRDDPQDHDHIIPDLNTSRMKVDFPRWEGDPIRWIACTERYFRFYRIADATRVEIAAIHLKRDTIYTIIGNLEKVFSGGDDMANIDLAATSSRPRTTSPPMKYDVHLATRTTEGVVKYNDMISDWEGKDLRYERLVTFTIKAPVPLRSKGIVKSATKLT
ncbi:hypothetical protein BHM03_00057697 [Ensete ventricosum]|nr:hypothetical protein BHM03_00057697 [Ensete ventricosum]